MQFGFPTNLDAIAARLAQIDPIEYSKTRNYLNGAVTRLSPYLTHGVLSTVDVLRSVLQRYTKEESYKLAFELAWREFFHTVWTVKSSEIFTDLRFTQPRRERIGIPQSVIGFQTGITMIDHEVQHLYEVGYMHNHARMWLAAIVCNHGRCGWQEGARWLYYYLLDGDLASNSLSWQWVAGAFRRNLYYAAQSNINQYALANFRNTHTFLDKEYAAFEAETSTPVELAEVVMPNLQSGVWQESSGDLTALLYGAQGTVLLVHPWMLDVKLCTEWNGLVIGIVDPVWFKDWPVSQQRVDFISSLYENCELDGWYYGSLTDLLARYAGDIDFAIQSYPLLDQAILVKYDVEILRKPQLFPEFYGILETCRKIILAFAIVI